MAATIPDSYPSRLQPLPPNDYDQHSRPLAHAAYDVCLSSEATAASAKLLRRARCLGWLFRLAPTDVGPDAIIQDILQCNRDPDSLSSLGHLYDRYLIRVCEFAALLVSRIEMEALLTSNDDQSRKTRGLLQRRCPILASHSRPSRQRCESLRKSWLPPMAMKRRRWHSPESLILFSLFCIGAKT